MHRLLRPTGGREPDLEPPRALAGGLAGAAALRPHGRRRCRTQSPPAPARRLEGGHGLVRLERVGPGAEEGVRERLQGVHQEDRASTSRSTRSTTTRSRSRSTPTSRASPTTCSPGSPATACSSSRQGPAVADIDDVWEKLGGSSPTRSRTRRRALDGKQYFVPFYNYPWAVFYRKSVWEKNGYTVPRPGRVHGARQEDEGGRADADRLRATRTAGPRWARSTTSTCASTATTSTSA